MRELSSAACARTPGRSARRCRPLARRIGDAPVDRAPGAPGNSGQTSRTRSHRRDHVVEALVARTRSRCLERRSERSMPAGAHHPHGVRMQRLGVASGAERLDRAADELLGQRLGHLRARAVARAQEQHARTGSPAGAGAPRARAAARDAAPRRRAQQLAAAREIEAVVGVAAVGRAAAHADTSPPSRSWREVVGDQALRPADERAELAHPPIAARQLAEHAPAQRMAGERQEARRGDGPTQVGGSHARHDTSSQFDGSSACQPAKR